MTKLREWFHLATPEERQQLADLSNTSVAYLLQIAGGWRKNQKIGLALRLHFATRLMHVRSAKRLPIVELTNFADEADMPTPEVLAEIGEKNVVLY